ncbi:MAG: hypothetical protein ABSA75_03825 [Candidatus Bathyarchaeia archaeon]
MAQKKARNIFIIVIITLCVITAVSLTAIFYSIQIANLQNQMNDLQAPKLVNISLGYSDNSQGIIHVTGFVYNTGNVTANGCYVDVSLSRDGATLNSTNLYFGKDSSLDPLFGGDYVSGETSTYVDGNVTYTGSPPTNVTLTLGWIAPWQILIP